jgi:hypothetical protein
MLLMPNKGQKFVFVTLLTLVIVAAVVAYFATSPNDALAPAKLKRGSDQAPLVDQGPLQAARTCARSATTSDEVDYGNEALRLADRSVDLAFSMALRDAELNPPPESPEVKKIDTHIDKLQADINTDKDIVAEFTKLQQNPGSSDPDEIAEQIETAKAQQSVTEDELDEARQALLRAGGDRQTRI